MGFSQSFLLRQTLLLQLLNLLQILRFRFFVRKNYLISRSHKPKSPFALYLIVLLSRRSNCVKKISIVRH